MSVVQNLQENVQDIGVGLLNLIKQDHGIGFPADFLGQLTGLIIAHIAGGRADDPGDGVLFHKLRHVQANQGLRCMEEILGQPFDQFCLSHTGGAHKDEGHRFPFGGDPHPVPADGGGYGGNGLILADDVLLQTVFQLGQTLVFLLLDGAGGNLGPKLHHAGQALQSQGRGLLLAQFLLFL